jgi:hypothetical protein
LEDLNIAAAGRTDPSERALRGAERTGQTTRKFVSVAQSMIYERSLERADGCNAPIE